MAYNILLMLNTTKIMKQNKIEQEREEKKKEEGRKRGDKPVSIRFKSVRVRVACLAKHVLKTY